MRVVAAACAALLLAACTDGGRSATPSPTASATTPAPSPSPTETTPPAAGGVTVVAVPKGFTGGFTTPSGNIACDVSDEFVRCQAAQQPWKEQPRGADCADTKMEWRTRLVLSVERGAALRGECDYPIPAGAAPLAYGTRLDVGRTRCFSETTGLTCWMHGTRHGFFVSRATYRTTAQPPAAAVAATPSPTPSGPVLEVPRGFRGGFQAHDHGIVCDLDDKQVHCLVLGGARWTPSPDPEPCEFDRSVEVILSTGRGRSFQGCRSDSLGGGGELRAGRGIRIGDIRCDATASALECRNTATKHGFFVSETAFRGY